LALPDRLVSSALAPIWFYPQGELNGEVERDCCPLRLLSCLPLAAGRFLVPKTGIEGKEGGAYISTR